MSGSDAEKKAETIYEMIRLSSEDRPFAFDSMEQLRTELGAWKENNPGLSELSRSGPEVLMAFLQRSFDWISAEARIEKNFRIVHTLCDAIVYALTEVPKPLPTDLILRLLSEYHGQMASMARIYFPFQQFLFIVTRDQVTDEMRAELRKLAFYFAPGPTGKIDEATKRIRDRITDLSRVEGEKQLDPGRGPWSQIVFDEFKAKDEITRAGWESLLEHCRLLEQTVPGTKWKKRSQELIGVLGEAEVAEDMLRWLALGPTPGQPSEARAPIEDSAYQKGVVWCVAMRNTREAASAMAEFGIACLRKIRVIGAVSQKVGFACVQALGEMHCAEAVTQLTRLRAKVKYTVATRLIEKSLRQAAERSGLTVQELEDMSVQRYELDPLGRTEIQIADAKATVHLREDGRVTTVWQKAEGKPMKSAPAQVRKAFPKEVRSVATLAKELGQAYVAQRSRLESTFLRPTGMPATHWRKYFIDHPLLGFLGRRLIWVFRNGQDGEQSGIWLDGKIADAQGNIIDAGKADKVRLWHPLSSEEAEVQQWRERIFAANIRQPFRQAFREFYRVTEAERETKLYSNRFAGVLMRQHQFASLCHAREWSYRLMGAGFDGANVPTKKFDAWNMHAEFYVDLPADRADSPRESALGAQSGAGINLLVGSDQVRFYRDSREIAVDEVPAVVYSEVMRDVDLFTSVCAAGDDEGWSDQGDRGIGVLTGQFAIQEVSAVIALRAEMLSRVLPHTRIRERCKVQKSWLEVRGNLGTYRIGLAWDAAGLATDTGMRWLKIPRKALDAVVLDLADVPIELDHRSETILQKAHVLADDWKMDLPELVRQLMPE
jgi:hypothetical protein